MAKTKNKATENIPDVPGAQMIDIANLKQPEMKFEPLSGDEMIGLFRQFMDAQQAYFPQMLGNQLAAQQALFRQMSQLQREQAGPFARKAYRQMLKYQPEFAAAYKGLGGRIAQGLAQGYELGPDLAREVEQGIRAGQTARGNYLGPAQVAEEAFGRGQSALALYNQRIGQAQNYLQGRNPLDVMGGFAGSFMSQNYYPQTTYLDPTLGLKAADIRQQGMSSYNSTLNSALQDYNRNYISAFNSNNEAQYNNYDRNFEQFLFGEARRRGLFSMPGAMGGGMGGGLGGMLGMGASVLGAGASAAAGAGILGGGATAGIVGGIGAGLAAF